jgi:hypothetical protein
MRISELKQIIKKEIRQVINENNLLLEKTNTKIIKINFNIDWNSEIGKVEDEFTLAFSPNSTGVFSLGNDIEKFSGLNLKDAQKYKETPSDAYVYGLCNAMNGGADIFFWTNGMRLSGAAQQNGVWPAVIEQISHECTHLTRLILTRAIAKNNGVDIVNGEWITFDYGGGEYFWPAIGDIDDKNNPIVIIDEEAFATSVGLVVQTVTPHFLEMASTYIPTLFNQLGQPYSSQEEINEGWEIKNILVGLATLIGSLGGIKAQPNSQDNLSNKYKTELSYTDENLKNTYNALIGYLIGLSNAGKEKKTVEQMGAIKEARIYCENLRDNKSPKSLSKPAEIVLQYAKDVIEKMNKSQIQQLIETGKNIQTTS